MQRPWLLHSPFDAPGWSRGPRPLLAANDNDFFDPPPAVGARLPTIRRVMSAVAACCAGGTAATAPARFTRTAHAA